MRRKPQDARRCVTDVPCPGMATVGRHRWVTKFKMRLLCWLGLALLAAITSHAAQPPNVVVILTDDQGWGDLSLHGNTNLSTPHIDGLARDGCRFENFYVCQVCAPTRAEFLTGRYYPKTGVSGVSRGQERLNADETTLADLFRSAGYATGCFGKWHNGTQPSLHPNDRGFDEFYGFTSGHWGHYFSPPLDHNGRRVRGNGFVVDDFTNHAIEFIKAHRQQPFFCYLPLNTPHSPMMVADRFYKRFADVDPELRHRDPSREDVMMTRAALAMCENIDWNVGRLLKTLEDLQISDRTLVVFFCDNGPNSFRYNGGMKGRKGTIDEGGLRSPLLIRWPGKIRAGKQVTQVAAAIDLLPTLTRCVGIDARPEKPLDGVDLTPLLTGDQTAWPARALFAIKNKQVSVRTQRFRLDASGKLFDISQDRGQRVDVTDRFPDEAARLSALATRHSEQMQQHFDRNRQRPFHVGFGPVTTLPARDGIAHGSIQRSSKAPNNSFFTHWTRDEDAITWDIQVAESGTYEAILYYTCAAGDQGVTMQLSTDGGEATRAVVKRVFDPPLYDKSLERVEKSHYFVKDFIPLRLGALSLTRGHAVLRLQALRIQGKRAVDVHSVELVKREKSTSEP